MPLHKLTRNSKLTLTEREDATLTGARFHPVINPSKLKNSWLIKQRKLKFNDRIKGIRKAVESLPQKTQIMISKEISEFEEQFKNKEFRKVTLEDALMRLEIHINNVKNIIAKHN